MGLTADTSGRTARAPVHGLGDALGNDPGDGLRNGMSDGLSDRLSNHSSNRIPQPARKQVTVLFCDVVDYTSRSVTLDPEDLADEIRAFQALCAAVSEQYHGHISSYLGDGILVLFGHPYADEFGPEHALRAAMEMVKRVRGNNVSEQWRGREPMRIRIGIATSLVVVGERGGGHELVFGEAPNLAARLQSLAAPNTVLVAPRTRRLVGGAFKFRDLGEHRLKGFRQPLNAWQLLHASTFQNRSITSLKRVTTRFVSRPAELQYLQENYALALGGRGRIVHLSGDPGIGKSRLIRAFEKTIDKQDMQRLRVTCSPYFRRSPFKPIVDGTYRWLQIGVGDDLDTRQENVRRAMLEIGLDGADEHALFSELLAIPMPPGSSAQACLDLSAAEKRRRSVDALSRVVIRLSRLHPLLLVVEDLHWADPATLAVLGDIIARAHGEKLFAIFTSRSGFVPPWPRPDWLVERPLGGLTAEQSGRLIATVFEAHPLPERVKQTLIRKSGGVPLFLEECSWHALTQMRLENMSHGQSQAQSHDQIREADSGYLGSLFTVPDTLQDYLNARLDQLGEAKSFAQLAAAFGADFRYSLISKIAAQNGIDADSGMDVLLEARLIQVTPDKAEDRAEDRYEFRHAMLQDAAYESLLKKTRQRYHRHIVALLQDDPDISRQHPELIAYHHARTLPAKPRYKPPTQTSTKSKSESDIENNF